MSDTETDRTRPSESSMREQSDADEVRRRYDAWLGDEGRVVEWTAPSTTGFSSLTYLATVERDGGTRREVLRSTPQGPTIFREYDLAKQVACLRQLAEVVPTPEVLAFEPDPGPLGQPFYVMGHVDGRIPDDNPPYALVGWLHDETPDVQQRHYESGVDVLAALHGCRPQDVGLADVLGAPSGGTGLDAEVAAWKDLLAWGREGTDQPVIDTAWEWLDAHRPDDPDRDVVLWGDARLCNLVFSPEGDVRAVLDWEMAGTGPAEVDLAWFLWMDRQFTEVFDAPRLEGFPGEDVLRERWERRVGHAATDLDWYLVFAGVRFSTTIMRVGIRAIADGSVPADADVYRNHLGTRLLARTLDLEPPGEIGLMG